MRTRLQQSCERMRSEMLEARHELSASLANNQMLTTELHEFQQRGKQHDQVAGVLITQLIDSQKSRSTNSVCVGLTPT